MVWLSWRPTASTSGARQVVESQPHLQQRNRLASPRSPGSGSVDAYDTWRWPSARLKTQTSVPDPSTTAFFTPKELRLLGHKPKALESTWGYQPRVIEAADGRSVRELRAANFTCKELLESGGFTMRELKVGGFKADELRAIGCSVKDLRPYSVSELRAGGFEAFECKASCLFAIGEVIWRSEHATALV